MPAVVDYSYARPAPSDIVGAGYWGAMRYLGNDSRCLDVAEADRLLQAGLGIGLIWETSARRPLEGRSAGLTDGLSANDYADFLAAPNIPIYYAVDFQPTPDEIRGPITDYFYGCTEAHGRPVRAYGNAAVVHHLVAETSIMPTAWQCAAWSYPGTAPGTPISDGGFNLVLSPYAHMLQNIGYVLGDSSDHNSLITHDRSFMWGYETTGGDEMTDDDWNHMTSLLNTMIVGKLAMHSSPSVLLADEHGQFMLVMTNEGPRRYIFGPAEVDMAAKVGLIAPQKPTTPPAPSPYAYDVGQLTDAERDVLYGYPTF